MTDTSVYLYRSGNGAYGFTRNKNGTGLSDEMDPLVLHRRDQPGQVGDSRLSEGI